MARVIGNPLGFQRREIRPGPRGSCRRPWQVSTQPSVLRAMYRTPEVGGSADGVVVQRWYRERLVGDATTAAAERGAARGARETRVAARGGAI